jgi:hypothetical protein
LLKVSLGFCFQQDFEQNFFGNSASFPANPLCGIDAAQRSSSFFGRAKQEVGGYTNTTHMSISGVAQHPLRNPQAQQPDRHWPAWRRSPSIRSDAGKKPATKMFSRNSVPLALQCLRAASEDRAEGKRANQRRGKYLDQLAAPASWNRVVACPIDTFRRPTEYM